MNREERGISSTIIVIVILIAVASAGAIVYITTRPEPEFQVQNLSLSSDKVAKGEPVTVQVEVTNVGDAEGTHTVELKIENEILKRKVSLESGESKTIDFDIEKQEKGTYNLNVEDFSESFEVVEPANFEYSNLQEELENANAFVTISPRTDFTEEEDAREQEPHMLNIGPF